MVKPRAERIEGKHPPVAPVFWPFIMVGMNLLTLAVSWTSTTAGTLKKQAPTLVASRTALPPRGRCACGLKTGSAGPDGYGRNC
jgi:hypothetical protein